MGDSVSKFFLDNSFLEEPKENKELSEDVVNILELFRLLKTEDKATAKRLIREESIF
jgi:hypothetical protein